MRARAVSGVLPAGMLLFIVLLRHVEGPVFFVAHATRLGGLSTDCIS